MDGNEYYLYALLHPILGEVRYIGYTGRPLEKRLKEHINSSRSSDAKTHRGKWIQSLLETDYIPSIKLLEVTTKDKVKQRERELIIEYRKTTNLVNGTEGGDGSVGHKITEEGKRKISVAAKARLKKYNPILLVSLKDNSTVPCASRHDAALYLNCSPHSITACLLKQRASVNNHICEPLIIRGGTYRR